MSLEQPVQFLKGVGPKRAEALARLGIHTLSDMVRCVPRSWENRRPTILDKPPPDGRVVLFGRVLRSRAARAGPSLSVFSADVRVPDQGESVEAVWFKRLSRRYDPFASLKKDLSPGADVWIVGRTEPGLTRVRRVSAEEYYVAGDPSASLHVDRLVPVYPLTEGLSARFFRETMAAALRAVSGRIAESLPRALLERRELLTLPQALPAVHFPRNGAELDEARRRLAYEELLVLVLAWSLKHRQVHAVSKGYGYEIRKSLLTPFKARLGFEMTAAQKRVIHEIFEDLRGPHPMTRLLQGDVGSGKTVVALSALLLAVENGYQGAFLAPTEILAEQHFWTVSSFLGDLPVRVRLLTGRMPKKEREAALAAAREGTADLLLGTHALLEEDVRFARLRLAVVDEQHRFGVRQRATLRRKGPPLDFLMMTATPIPRTLSLALYGDLDVSTLDEMPPGRRPSRTLHVDEGAAFETVRRAVAEGRQAYIVYPVIQESSRSEIKAAEAEFERLRGAVFPGLRLALLHGRLGAKAKTRVMREFAQGALDVLVATPVVEVGLDIPNASVMVIQNAERFGLASLHQLRGRIGRGRGDSVCCLVADPGTEESQRRIAILCETHDGFRIGEEDLRLRGPGELLGVAQHGELALSVADLARDAELLARAREDASALLGADSLLQSRENAGLRGELIARYQKNWNFVDLA